MKQSIEINTISQVHQMFELPSPKHQLISIIHNCDIKKLAPLHEVKLINNLYMIVFKSTNNCSFFGYGRNSYDYEEGTLVFTAPGQVMEFDNSNMEENQIDLDGWSLLFHPNVFRKSDLMDTMSRYSFFQYDSNEALHVSDNERRAIEDLLHKIIQEYSQKLDRHSQHLIVSNIELFLDYCLRFYDRQFFSRTNLNTDTISKFETFLTNYYSSNQNHEQGIPSVEYCARRLNFSPNYLSDLLKKETGKTALEHIHFFLIDRAKKSLLNSPNTISEIAYSLGFEYPQHFSNLFKSKTGFSPTEYRHSN
jgi:AraC-like DNA-binding protein